jgi:hypothetical protein
MSAVCQFQDLESAVLTAQEIIQYGVSIARIELLNKDQIDISIEYSKLENLKSLPTLFYEFHGSESTNKESIEIVEEISKVIVVVTSLGQQQQKKEIKYGKQDIMYTTQLKLKVIT